MDRILLQIPTWTQIPTMHLKMNAEFSSSELDRFLSLDGGGDGEEEVGSARGK